MEKFVWFIVQMDRFVRGDRKFHRTDRQRIFLCDSMGHFVKTGKSDDHSWATVRRSFDRLDVQNYRAGEELRNEPGSDSSPVG